MIIGAAFVKKLRALAAQYQEPVRASRGHKKLFFVFCRKFNSNMLAKRWRLFSNIDNDIEHDTRDYPNELCLCMWLVLKVHPTQNAVRSPRLILLDKAYPRSLEKFVFTKCLKKIPARIFENLRLENQHSGN